MNIIANTRLKLSNVAFGHGFGHGFGRCEVAGRSVIRLLKWNSANSVAHPLDKS